MLVSDIRDNFRGSTEEDIEKAMNAALKAIKPRAQLEFTEINTGAYNSVALPEHPFEVLSIKDAAKANIKFRTAGQQIICDRVLKQPVVVAYVTAHEHQRWLQEVLADIRLRLKNAAK